jgi:outer membrane protein assembly factor BamA
LKALGAGFLVLTSILAERSFAEDLADRRNGFIPVGTIITDPAVGLGGGLGLVFLQPGAARNEEDVRPNMTGIAGFGTDNGTWGAGIADAREWQQVDIKTIATALTLSANLDLFATGNGEAGREYHLETWGATVEAHRAVPRSHAFVGIRYSFAEVTTKFEDGGRTPGIGAGDEGRRQTLSALTPMLTFDSRDNVFTPSRGAYAQLTISSFSELLGSDRTFQLVSVSDMWFTPVGERLTFGIKADVAVSSRNTPFYLRPFVQLRGIESLRLQDEEMAQVETELRWQRWSRFSLVAFGGAGVVWKGMEDLDRPRDVVTGGFGFRYLASKKFGVHVGFDVGFGPGEPIAYFQFGSAWFRP